MNRYIAFLDILGFGDLVREEKLDVVKERVKRALDWVDAAVRAAPQVGFDGHNVRGVHRFSFSDTFVLLSEDESAPALLSFLNATTVLTRALFAEKLPVRGAITFGEADFLPDPHNQHAVGKGIIAAADFEKSQDWIGVTVLEDAIPNDGRQLMADVLFDPVLVRWDVPIKAKPGEDSVLRNRLVVNWLYNVRVKYSPQSVFRQSSDEKARRKVENTNAFVSHILDHRLHRGRNFHCNTKGEPIFTPSLEFLGAAGPYYGDDSYL
jgi:hypothetical protein